VFNEDCCERQSKRRSSSYLFTSSSTELASNLGKQHQSKIMNSRYRGKMYSRKRVLLRYDTSLEMQANLTLFYHRVCFCSPPTRHKNIFEVRRNYLDVEYTYHTLTQRQILKQLQNINGIYSKILRHVYSI
jgi:hypothetical protein